MVDGGDHMSLFNIFNNYFHTGDDSVAIISQHINTPPVAPSWHNPDLPRALEALILRLLAKVPEERPESAAAVRQALAAASSTATARADSPVDAPANDASNPDMPGTRFDKYEGPSFQLVDAREQTWKLAAGDEAALIVGRTDTVHLRAGSGRDLSDKGV